MELLSQLGGAFRQRYHQLSILQDSTGQRIRWTYQDIGERVAVLSKLIATEAADNVSKEQNIPIVGLFLNTSIASFIGTLAVLRARAAFMPLDCSWPLIKLKAMLDDARPVLVLWADKECHGCGPLAYAGCPLLQIPSSLLQPADNGAGWTNTGDEATRIDQHVSAKLKEAAPDSIAYVMYTSGSTGTPQAVLGTSEGILNRCGWTQRAHPFTAGDVVCFHTAPTFVDSIWQIFGPLLGGVPLLVLPPPASRNMAALLSALRQHVVTHFVAVPTLLAALLQHLELSGQQMPPTLRLLVSSGEPLPVGLLRRLQASLPPHAVVLNLYGSTETAADCTCCNATAWLQGNASRVTPPAATSPTCSPHPSVTGRLAAAVHPHHAQLSAQVQQAAAVIGQQTAGRNEPDSHGVGQETAGKSTVSHGEANLKTGQGALHPPEGEVPEQSSSSGVASELGGYVPVGWPLDNMAVFITAPMGEGRQDGSRSEDGAVGWITASDVLGWGEVGEVCVMGTGICAGYLRQSEQAGQRFPHFPRDQLEAACHRILWGKRSSGDSPLLHAERVFRTGDLGLITSQGLEIRGRLDLQAKNHGVRIDLLEVEGCLAAHPQVVAAAAKVWPSGARGGMRLCAYVELREPQYGAETCAQLRLWCSERLSAAAVPSYIILLPAMPRSSAGKIQRGALPNPADLTQPDTYSPSHLHMQMEEEGMPEGGAQTLPDGFPYSGPGGLEAAAMRAFGAALGQGPRGLEPVTDFWSAGGDSLAAAQVAGWLGVDVRLLTAFPTARALAAQMRSIQAPIPVHTSDARERLGREAEPSRLARDAHHGRSTSDAVPTKRHRLIMQKANQESGGAYWTLTPPDPALGGAVLQSCGRVSFWPAAVSSADVQSAATLPAGVPSGPPAAAAGPAHPTPPPSLADAGSEQTVGTQQQHSAKHRDVEAQEAEALQQQVTAGDADDGAQKIEDRVRTKRGREVPSIAQGVAEGEGRGTRAAGTAWRVKLRDCVDASPAILVQSALAAAADPTGVADSTRQQAEKLPLRWYAFGCSHGGDVVCIDGASGTPVWKTCIEGRAESGLTLTGSLQHVAVASSGGRLHFLRTTDGAEVGSCDAGGALKAAPVTDPWLGHIWIASHARELIVCEAPGKAILRQPCTSPVSAPVGFHAACKRAYLALLDGSLTALDVVFGSDGAERGNALKLAVAWSIRICGPIFAAPSVVPDTCSVLIASAQGLVMAVSAAGEVLWKSELGSAVFASPCFLPGPEKGYQALVGCHNGLLHSLRCMDGSVQWLQQIGIAGISTSATVMISSDYISRLLTVSAKEEGTLEPQRAYVELMSASAPESAEHASLPPCMSSTVLGKEVSIACCDSSGVVGHFQFDKMFTQELLMLERIKLGSELFSSPVAFDGCIVVGCRDDHLYCLHLAM